MNNVMKSLAIGVGVGAVILLLSSSGAYAAPALVQIGVGSCTVADGNGNFITTNNPNLKIKVSTQSANSTLILSCHVDNVPNDTGHAVSYGPADGMCIINDPLRGPRVADVWRETLSADGQALLSC
jgi:hypothetical protein